MQQILLQMQQLILPKAGSREVTTNPAHIHADSDNVTIREADRGNSKAYSLDRLKRDRPDLFADVVSNKISAIGQR